MPDNRLDKQLAFLVEIDKLKATFRRAFLVADPDRRENSAEHSWHVSVMALILAEHSSADIELSRVIKMLLIHDIVEIDAGDTSIYDNQASLNKTTREMQGANRIFGLLPDDQAKGLLEIWDEFEAGKTREAKFARALDRLIPLLHNYHTQGKRWKLDGITYEQVVAVNQSIRGGSPELWKLALSIINECVEKGYSKKK